MDEHPALPARNDASTSTWPQAKQYTEGTSNITAVAFGPESGAVFLAVGTDSRVDVLIRDLNDRELSYRPFKSFYLSSRVTALAWSHRAFAASRDTFVWNLELAAACADNQIRLLSASSDEPGPDVAIFGTPVAGGHKARINGLAFCTITDSGLESVALASVSDDKSCIIWNVEEGPSLWCRIQKRHPLQTVTKHPRRASGVLVSSSFGEVFEILIPGNEAEVTSMELVVPPRLAATCEGKRSAGEIGTSDWKPDNPDVVGAAYGDRWYIWDLNKLRGVAPTQFGDTQTKAGHSFKWSPSDRNLFATASFDVGTTDAVKIWDVRFPHKPISVHLPSYGERVAAIDWSWEGPWLAVAKGRNVVFVRTDRTM